MPKTGENYGKHKMFQWYKLIFKSLEKDGSHNTDDLLYAKIKNEHDKITTLLDNVVSGLGFLFRRTTIGCPILSSHANTLTHTPKITPPSTPKSTTKRNNDGFISPPLRKTVRRFLLETPNCRQVNLENRFNFPNSVNESEFQPLPKTQHKNTQNLNINKAYNPRIQAEVCDNLVFPKQ
ncbi:hypothetical protein TNIN_76761 [Trichonephila inaurata madagascariensis]|uniref:Uncharacterized protein n=1 Tax=Trichonephila inaurata madagascariensis TaxID=2747483 RepID=A0A8X7C084_9ARAC|nr:hypothetical protein TNIN_76761 [Trichonephila inaurata madagascariensis]